MQRTFNFKDKSFAVYGLAITGKSVVKFLKKNKVNEILAWDDRLVENNKKLDRFRVNLDVVDHIIVSPGINIKKSRFKKLLFKNKKKNYNRS